MVDALNQKHPLKEKLAALLIFAVIFATVAQELTSLDCITAILTVAAEVGIIAVGVSFLMISGECDISVGSILLLSTYVFTTIANKGFAPHWRFW